MPERRLQTTSGQVRPTLEVKRRVLGADEKAELGVRLAHAADPQKVYDEVVNEARQDGDTAAADALLDGTPGTSKMITFGKKTGDPALANTTISVMVDDLIPNP